MVPSDDFLGQRFFASMPNELKKLYDKSLVPDNQSSYKGFVLDEVTANMHDDMDELTNKYFKAKLDWFLAEQMKQLRFTTRELEEASYHAGPGGKDEFIKKRAEFMYNYMDYDNDRANVRERLVKNINKKTTLKDIGELLDKFLLDERAESLKYTDNSKNGQDLLVKSAAKDFTNLDLTWTGRIFKDMDPLKPLLLDDNSPLDGMADS